MQQKFQPLELLFQPLELFWRKTDGELSFVQKAMAKGMSLNEKKDYAKKLIIHDNLTQKEAAARAGVSLVTMNKWYKQGNWEKLKQSMLVTRDVQLSRMYMQLDELTTKIMGKEEGSRFADAKEADTISKLTSSIKTLETDASIADVVEVSKRFLNWLRPIAPDKAMEYARLSDDFIKDLLKR